MKKMLMTMLCLLMALGMGAKNDDVQLKVIVKGYEGGYVMLAHGHDYMTTTHYGPTRRGASTCAATWNGPHS